MKKILLPYFRRFRKLKKIIRKILKPIKKRLIKIKKLISNYPQISFYGGLIVLFLLIAVGNIIRKPKTEIIEKQLPIKKVKTYILGRAPTIILEGKIEKTGVITIVAQMGGVVSNINISEGQTVAKGTNLISLSTSYGGGNAASVQRQIAYLNFKNQEETIETQKEIIDAQREIADKTDQNQEKLRELTRNSKDEAQDQLNLNEDILTTVSDNLTNLEQATNSAENKDLILATKQLKSQFLAAVGQLKSIVRSSDYTGGDDNILADLSHLQRDILVHQLDIQEKALELGLEISRLNLRLSQINEQLSHPISPITGIVERIYVRPGQLVSPGTPLLILSGLSESNKIVITTSSSIAQNVSKLEESKLFLKNQTISLYPSFISSEPTDGNLFSIIYMIPENEDIVFHDNEYIQIQIPIGYPNTGTSIPYIPLDSVYQTQDQAYVFIVDNQTAVSREIQLGSVFGSYVQVLEGIDQNDIIILDRTVISGSIIEPL